MRHVLGPEDLADRGEDLREADLEEIKHVELENLNMAKIPDHQREGQLRSVGKDLDLKKEEPQKAPHSLKVNLF